ncbi:MAG: 4-alpha-glucanotransferase [Planctomycetota bacterium]|jgi:4-alpha-glucanotransferase|nr:4-alpha-glucanotransferase [Planctomycetota bacterium]
MSFTRSAGVLLHPSSLPGGQGIGDFGAAARQFLDYLRRAKQTLWQVLPLGAVNDSGSPYQTFSSFAGNPLFIALDDLVAAGLLRDEDLRHAPGNGARADFAAARNFKMPRLRQAFDLFRRGATGAAAANFQRFKEAEKFWLDDYALFAAARERFGGKPWWRWDDADLAKHSPDAVKHWTAELADAGEFVKWTQFVFYAQWLGLKKRANDAGIKIIGDIPIYPAHDSADVWAAPEFFAVSRATGEAQFVAGCPPDYFCADGQLWGNPVYDWEAVKKDNYRWWAMRLRGALRQTDILRLDHFRGFEAYWATPGTEKTARNGKWVRGPGAEFFTAMKREIGDDLPLIAEDLGAITPAVNQLRDECGFPGMKVLQFAFGDGANFYRPHAYATNSVVYTGTHDNDTTRGWYAGGADYANIGRDVFAQERDLCRRYLATDGRNIHWDLIRAALASVAVFAIYPLQDILGLGNDCRMNRPGLGEGNWTWRLTADQLANAEVNYLRELTELFDRAG